MDNDPIFALLQQKMAEGSWDSSGAFTIEAGRAASRLGKDFAATYPGQYPLKFVQSAVAMGMNRLVFKSKRQALRVEFFEPKVPEFLEYFKFALERVGELPQSTPFLDLFQGIWGGLADHGHQVEAMICWQGESRRYEFSTDGVKELPSSGPVKGKKKPALTLLMTRSTANLRTEGRMIRERCDFAPLELLWNGRRLPRNSWVRTKTAAAEDWYLRWAPRGFRLGESYLTRGNNHPGTTIWLPALNRRGVLAWGEGHPGSRPRFWSPRKDNVLYHSGVGTGNFCGAVAQTLDSKARTPVIFVSKGVVVDSPAPVLVPAGGLAVLDCYSASLRTDVFGLRLVVDRQLNSVVGILKQRMAELHQRLRPHVYPLPVRRRIIENMPLGAGLTAVALAPFLPISGVVLLGGIGQIALWKLGRGLSKSMVPHGFLDALSKVLPACVPGDRLNLNTSRASRTYRLK